MLNLEAKQSAKIGSIVSPFAVRPARSPAEPIRAARGLDAIAVGTLVVVAVIAALTFRDYGLGWDDYTHSQYGSLLVSLYESGFADKRALSFVNLYMYGGGFDLLATLAAKVLPFDLFETRRLVGAAIGLVGLFVTWRLARRLGGPLAGLLALVLLATCPLYYGHMFMNAKDAPFAVAMAIALLGIVRAFTEYPRATPATIALCGIGVGLALGSRVMGGFALLNALLPLLLVVAIRSRESGFKPALSECRSFLAPFIPGTLLAYLVMGLVWPWAVVSPLNPFRAVEYFSNFFEKPWRELFDGRLILVPDMPRSYVPTLIALTLPELMLVLGLCGTVVAIVAAARGEAGRAGLAAGRRAALLATALAAALPLLVTVAMRPAMYNGIRHFVFLMPPLAALGGLAGAWIAQRLHRYGRTAMTAAAVVLVIGLASPVVEMARLHPYEYTHFNHIAGGVAGARPRYMLDYWGLSMRQASQQLHALLAERGETPRGKTWAVAVCGPHPAVVVALGPQYSAIWNPKGADFAMTLGEFYCAKLDAPILFDVMREGVVYARVYDIRGRSVSTLLTVRGPD
ncbi:MAG TPA: glycosyltransferase family 39 protein [Xanthobacteraceae bacterium]|nr:glycosyltransferase family 39 protein [Xanthobacteraceae bacterium]